MFRRLVVDGSRIHEFSERARCWNYAYARSRLDSESSGNYQLLRPDMSVIGVVFVQFNVEDIEMSENALLVPMYMRQRWDIQYGNQVLLQPLQWVPPLVRSLRLAIHIVESRDRSPDVKAAGGRAITAAQLAAWLPTDICVHVRQRLVAAVTDLNGDRLQLCVQVDHVDADQLVDVETSDTGVADWGQVRDVSSTDVTWSVAPNDSPFLHIVDSAAGQDDAAALAAADTAAAAAAAADTDGIGSAAALRAAGIGGYWEQANTLFKRVVMPRQLPRDVLQAYGDAVRPVRGAVLFGPPGCGKTRLAAALATQLHAASVQIVAGPTILSELNGKSEEKMRALFNDARRDYDLLADASPLHVIIFDEFDALARRRTRESSTHDGGVLDRVVNQLLACMDGVEPLNNILVIGLTNRLELIDEALLRPGRMELHLELGLPDADARADILDIHTAAMRAADKCTADVRGFVDRTAGWTGAELTAMVHGAVARAMDRVFDRRTMRLDAYPVVTQDDFDSAWAAVTPQFAAAVVPPRVPEFPTLGAAMRALDLMVQTERAPRVVVALVPRTRDALYQVSEAVPEALLHVQVLATELVASCAQQRASLAHSILLRSERLGCRVPTLCVWDVVDWCVETRDWASVGALRCALRRAAPCSTHLVLCTDDVVTPVLDSLGLTQCAEAVVVLRVVGGADVDAAPAAPAAATA